MFLENHYQNAYVTRDLDQAIEFFRTRYGFSGFQRHEVTYELTTPKGRGTASSKLALGWIGNLQYELIQPVSGLVDVFTQDLPDKYPLRFHHVCMRVQNDWAAFRGEVDQQKRAVVAEGGTPGHLMWLYIDARDTVGHYLEYCWASPERWKLMGGR